MLWWNWIDSARKDAGDSKAAKFYSSLGGIKVSTEAGKCALVLLRTRRVPPQTNNRFPMIKQAIAAIATLSLTVLLASTAGAATSYAHSMHAHAGANAMHASAKHGHMHKMKNRHDKAHRHNGHAKAHLKSGSV